MVVQDAAMPNIADWRPQPRIVQVIVVRMPMTLTSVPLLRDKSVVQVVRDWNDLGQTTTGDAMIRTLYPTGAHAQKLRGEELVAQTGTQRAALFGRRLIASGLCLTAAVWASSTAIAQQQYCPTPTYGEPAFLQQCPPGYPGMSPVVPMPQYGVPQYGMPQQNMRAPYSPPAASSQGTSPGQQPSTGGTDASTEPGDSTSGAPAAPPSTPPSAQDTIQQAIGNNEQSNVQTAAFQRAERGYGGDGFGDQQYANTSYDRVGSIGDFFGGRLRARRSRIPISRAVFEFDGTATEYFREINEDPFFAFPHLKTRVFYPAADGTLTFTSDGEVRDLVSGNEFVFGPVNSTTVPIDDRGPFVASPDGVLGFDIAPVLDPTTGQPILFNADTFVTDQLIGTAEVFNIYREVVIPAPGEMVGRLKVAENNNPIPQDRFIFDYTYFDQVGLTANGTHVQRFAPGFEKTLFHGNVSVDVRLPIATTIDSTIPTSTSAVGFGNSGLTNTGQTEVGNLSLTGKVLLARDQQSALSIGLQTLFPTASDVVITDAANNNAELLRVQNQAVHLMPFLAWQHRPDDRSFYQWYLQYDRQNSGDEVYLRGNNVGEMNGADFVYADFSMGYWIYKNMPRMRTVRNGNRVHTAIDGTRFLTGFAPRLELHYNRSVDGIDSTNLPGIQLGDNVNKLETLNLTLGGTMLLGVDKELTLAWGTPLIDRNDSDFQNEFRVMFNWRMPN